MKKKIAFLIPQFYWGGMPHVASELIRLLENKYQIVLLLVNNKMDIRMETYDAKVVRLLGNKFTKFIQLRRILFRENFYAVISFGVIDNLLNVMLTPRGANRILTEHSTKSVENELEKKQSVKLLYKLGIEKLYPKADSVVAVSYGIRNDLKKNFGLKNVKVIYNPLTLSNVQNELSKEDRQLIESIKRNKGRIILNVGRLTDPKGQMNLVHSFKFLKGQNIHLVLIGEGPAEQEILREIKNNNLQDIIHVLGSRTNVMEWMRQCDIYASLSWFEGFPGVLVEAAMNGLPVIAPDIYSGPREILSQGRKRDYDSVMDFPVRFPNGILTRRFDFRSDTMDFSALEEEFAGVLKNFIDYKNDEHYKPSVSFIDNERIVALYEKLIERNEEF